MLISSLSPSANESRVKAASGVNIACGDYNREGIEHLVGCYGDQKLQAGYFNSSKAPGRTRFSMRPGHKRNIKLNKRNNDGYDDARNSSNKLKVKYSRNKSFRNSFHIAMLESCLGMRGAATPTTIRRASRKYTFDLYYPDNKKLVKIFNTLDPDQVAKYASLHDENILFIINGNKYGGDYCGINSYGVESVPDELHRIVEILDGVLFYNDAYWRPRNNRNSNKKWSLQLPIDYSLGYDQAMEDISHRNEDIGIV